MYCYSALDKAKEALLTGDYNNVIPACTKALMNAEELPEAWLMRATMYILRGQHALALSDLEDIVNSSNCDKKVRMLLVLNIFCYILIYSVLKYKRK